MFEDGGFFENGGLFQERGLLEDGLLLDNDGFDGGLGELEGGSEDALGKFDEGLKGELLTGGFGGEVICAGGGPLI